MPALITALIDKFDNSELVGAQIAAILVVESAAQQTLATAASKDPRLWALRVFSERSNPWSQFIDDPAQLDATPIVNVTLDNVTFEMSGSNVVERQKAVAVYNVDCYAYGVSVDSGSPSTGHDPGDAKAASEVGRAMRLVRNILFAGCYTYLGFPRGADQIVWRRWPQAITMFLPKIGEHAVEHVMGARMALQVEFSEFSPQVIGQPLELISATVQRAETGQVFLLAQYPH